MQLLIAEDDPILREGLYDLLTAEGFSCQLAADGEAALAQFQAADSKKWGQVIRDKGITFE